MIARREIWDYKNDGQVWVGKYRNSHNLLHWHPDCELLFVERGKIDVFCECKTHTLTPAQALFIDSEQVHYMQAVDPNTVLIVIIFDYELIRGFAGRYRLTSPVLTREYHIPEIYGALRAVLTRKQPFFGAEAAAKVRSLMIEIFRGEQIEEKSKADNRTSQSFKRLLEEINANYRFIAFEDAASFMGMSPAYFSRYFRKATGITFSQQLNLVRCDAAVSLIKEGGERSMTEIADLCGFGTIRNFNRIFKQLTGYAPRDLPHGFTFNERFSYPSENTFNPTLYDCELIETSAE